MNRLLVLLIAIACVITCRAEEADLLSADSVAACNAVDSVHPPKREIGAIRKTIRGFSKIDNRYIEPQHYNWAFMVQSTFNYDVFIIKGVEGQKLTLSPDVIMKIGPYFGWRWLFLGYTFDLKNISFNSKGKLKTEFDLSLYSNQIGVDLYYRRTGCDYKIRHAMIGDGVENSLLNNTPFDGIKVGITGASLYYIFNHKEFSYPAAFAQSTRQKISCGSWMAGIGYTRNSLELDYDKLESTISDRIGHEAKLDSGLRFNSIKYYNLNASVGYAYNWVFAKNWLACGSLSVAVAYKRQQGDMADKKNMADFVFKNFNLDAMARIAVVYNNNRWFAGMSALMNQQNYTKSRFECNNIFGSINVYCGLNFGVQKKYRKKKKD
ncbi:MAG: DUF4421 domain-containing protein [Prevotella sp.]|nr:DUF4421 domain-containing protein [Prevotella sp.]